MTIKEIFKKVDCYNAIAQHLRTAEAVVTFSEQFSIGSAEEFTNYKAFADYIRDQYIPEVAEPILSCKEYAIGKPHHFTVKLAFNYVSDVNVMISVDRAW